MSRPRSRSPRYRTSPRRHEGVGGYSRRFPWDEPDFDPQKVLAELDGVPMDRKRHPREDLEERWNYLREDARSDSRRRSPSFPDSRPPGLQHHPEPEEFYRRTPPPHPYELDYAERRRLSPDRREGGGEGARGRGGFREHYKGFENRGRLSHSPQRLSRERLPSAPQSHLEPREAAVGWRREEQGRSRGSPRPRSDDHAGGEGRERGRRDAQGLNRERRRDDPHQERSPPFKRHRREMDDSVHLGYGKEEFREQRFSPERLRDEFAGGTRGRFDELRPPKPLVVEHDHGIAKSRGPPRWQQFDSREEHNPDFDREERFRKSNSRSDMREEMRGRHIQDDRRNFGGENRRSPVMQDRSSPMGFAGRNGLTNNRGRGGPQPGRGRMNRGRGGRTETGPPRNHHRFQQFPDRRQDLPQERQRPAPRPPEEDYVDPMGTEPTWAEETALRQWERDRPGSVDRRLPRDDLDPKMPRQREQSWTAQQKTSETLTIKVDMSRPVNQNSMLCYSSDRQLSLDLVNVGRQRLDFLPMLEHSGTYRESAMHTGTFAQEIITLVHQVKEHYFRGDSITLNERFSAPREGVFAEEEDEEEEEQLVVVAEGRPMFSRGFSTNMNMLPDDEPLFVSTGQLQSSRLQPLRDPGDLRHDLERKRQERLEGVKVTIPGGSLSQRPLGPVSERTGEYADEDEAAQLDEAGFSSWSEEPGRRWAGNVGPRRGGSYRQNTGSQRRNSRLGNRLGPMRRQSNRNSAAGPSW